MLRYTSFYIFKFRYIGSKCYMGYFSYFGITSYLYCVWIPYFEPSEVCLAKFSVREAGMVKGKGAPSVEMLGCRPDMFAF